MVWTPAPGVLKTIVSAPEVALASRIAWRKEPGPESFVLVTVNVAEAEAAADIKPMINSVAMRVIIENFSTRGPPPLPGAAPAPADALHRESGPRKAGSRRSRWRTPRIP